MHLQLHDPTSALLHCRFAQSLLPRVRCHCRVWAEGKQRGGQRQVLVQSARHVQWVLSSRPRPRRGEHSGSLLLTWSECLAMLIVALPWSAMSRLKRLSRNLHALYAPVVWAEDQEMRRLRAQERRLEEELRQLGGASLTAKPTSGGLWRDLTYLWCS
jgi:hypothetical protein